MPVAYDSVTPDTESAAGTTTLTSGAWTIAGADRLLIGVIGTGDLTGSNPTGMDHPAAGGALTQIGATLSIGTHAKLSTWRLIAPAAASNTTKGTWAASQGEACIGGVSYTGADQTTPVGTAVTATGAATTATFTATAPALTTVVGDLCFAVAFYHETGSPGATGATPGGGATGRYDIEAAQIGGWGALQCAEFVATGTSTVMSVDFSDAVARNGSWGIIAFVVNAAAGGVGAASSHTDTGQTRNRPGRGPHSLGKFFRPRIDAFTSLIGPIAATASDTNTPTDSALADVSKVAVAADTNTPTDSALADVTKVAVAADTNTPTDSALADTTKVAVAADTNTPTDSALADTSKVASATDTNTPTDSAAALRVAGVAFGEDTNVPTDSAVAIRVTPPVTGGGHAWLRTYLQELYQREFAAAAALRKEAEEARLAALGPKPTLQRSKRTPKVAGRAAPRPAASESSKSPRVVFPTVPKLQPSLDEHLRGVTALPAPIKLTVRPKTIGLPQGVGELDADDVEALLALAKAFNL